jgi:hypothetical protein
MSTKGQKEPFLDFLRELCIERLTVHGSLPMEKRTASVGPEELRCDPQGSKGCLFYGYFLLIFPLLRFDRLDHWITNSKEEAGGKFNHRNCSLNKKPDLKTVYLWDPCKVPLHTICFKARIHELVGFSIFFYNQNLEVHL